LRCEDFEEFLFIATWNENVFMLSNLLFKSCTNSLPITPRDFSHTLKINTGKMEGKKGSRYRYIRGKEKNGSFDRRNFAILLQKKIRNDISRSNKESAKDER
jgi:hypothetical protein